jgi:hypothetical protein
MKEASLLSIMSLKFKAQCKGYWSFDDDNNSNAQKMRSKGDFHLLSEKNALDGEKVKVTSR